MPNWLKGITPSKIEKFLTLLVALSTWILRETISCVLTTYSADIWSDIPKKRGVLREIPWRNMSSVVKPLSAIIESPLEKGGGGGFRKPMHSTISALSDRRGLSNLPKPLRIVKGSWRIVKPKVDSRRSGVVIPEVWETISYDMETHTGSQFARDLESIPQVSAIGGWRCCRSDSNRTTRHNKWRPVIPDVDLQDT